VPGRSFVGRRNSHQQGRSTRRESRKLWSCSSGLAWRPFPWAGGSATRLLPNGGSDEQSISQRNRLHGEVRLGSPSIAYRSPLAQRWEDRGRGGRTGQPASRGRPGAQNLTYLERWSNARRALESDSPACPRLTGGRHGSKSSGAARARVTRSRWSCDRRSGSSRRAPSRAQKPGWSSAERRARAIRCSSQLRDPLLAERLGLGG